MNGKSRFQTVLRALPFWVASGVVLALTAGCGRDDIQVYKVSKEPASGEGAAQAAGLPASHPDISQAGAPRLQWKLPEGWQEVPPGEMRVASFKVADSANKQADVSVVPLPGRAGGDLANVNRWRDQVGLGAVGQDELAKLAELVEVAGQPAQLFDQAGTNAASGEPTRILAAVLNREGIAWFFKMTGDDNLVAKQKTAFVGFLKSVSFPAASAQAQLPASHPPLDGGATPSLLSGSTPSTEGRPTWDVPSGWHEMPAGQFLVAKFGLSGSGGAQTTVNVSKSVGDGGGALANVNRWRGQLGLTPLATSDLNAQLREVPVADGKAMFVEMAGADRSGQKAQLVAAIVSQGGQTWFYKLMGDAQVVEREKDAFNKFVQGVKY